MNHFAMEFLMTQQQKDIEQQARHAWMWSKDKSNRPENKKSLPVISTPVTACCTACC